MTDAHGHLPCSPAGSLDVCQLPIYYLPTCLLPTGCSLPQVAQDGGWISAAQMLTRPGTSLAQLAAAAAAEGVQGWERLQEMAAPDAGVDGGDSSSGSGSGSSGGGASSTRGPMACGAHASSAVDTAVFNCHYRPYLKKMESEVGG